MAFYSKYWNAVSSRVSSFTKDRFLGKKVMFVIYGRSYSGRVTRIVPNWKRRQGFFPEKMYRIETPNGSIYELSASKLTLFSSTPSKRSFSGRSRVSGFKRRRSYRNSY